MSRTLIVIPARLGSTRFPRKVLAPLAGRPVLEWCLDAARRARCGRVAVAVDHPEVARAVERRGGTAVMTSPSLRSGTDRVRAAVRELERRGLRFDAVVNLQGDEPLIGPATVREVAALLSGRGACDISTAVTPLSSGPGLRDPNVVKVAMGSAGRCLYFSRSPVPYGRGPARWWRHIGIYGFRRAALERFVRLGPSPLEKAESLEQLRALEAGMSIRAARVDDDSIAIDTPSDLRRAARAVRASRRTHG